MCECALPCQDEAARMTVCMKDVWLAGWLAGWLASYALLQEKEATLVVVLWGWQQHQLAYVRTYVLT